MPKSSLSLALLCAAAGELAQSQTPTPAAVSGAITNSVTGAPIPRVHVVLHPDDQRHFYGALSDGDGRSTIASVAPGHYSVEMQRTGFLMPLDAGANRTDCWAEEGSEPHASPEQLDQRSGSRRRGRADGIHLGHRRRRMERHEQRQHRQYRPLPPERPIAG